MESGWTGRETERGSVMDSIGRRCTCGAILLPDAMFCEMCGRKVIFSEDFLPEAEPAAEGRCPYCGSAIESDWVFCQICGKRINESGAEYIREDSSPAPEPEIRMNFPARKDKKTVPEAEAKRSFPEHEIGRAVPEPEIKMTFPEHEFKRTVPESEVKMSSSEKPKFDNPEDLFTAAGDL